MTANEIIITEIKGLRYENRRILSLLKQLLPVSDKKELWVRSREFNRKLKQHDREELSKDQLQYLRESKPELCKKLSSGHYLYNFTEYIK